jgi:hypothetical protein
MSAAQDPAPIAAPESRIRYWLYEQSDPKDARLLLMSSDSLWLQPDETRDTRVLALSALSRLEVLRGPDGHAGFGASVGAFVGAVVGSFTFEHGDHSPSAYQREVARGSLFAVAVAGVGALIGSQIHSYHWEDIPLNVSP